ncbi:DHA3 family multidrug efflux protein-like MFS transporter [Friedmanniella endophytica]|uniref:DHA3 family multidrug efflux protein-like MFS transporter n=1 Tax=Microlunatus kandeliicorticis TaxID=1759536 RepID=A0A7W3P686_9ACTN|nr:MFS transporter [Microlunatus kandeliicorticis]MBA8794697.1 DHA3 family multidrug efflux protein-like MFS transporter [Microlunatus kandeliicorticis]
MSDVTQETTAARFGTELRTAGGRVFLHLLISTLVVSVLNYTVWFAVTFWVYLETRSVFATGMIAGIFLVATASTGIWFGSLVDAHHKKTIMQVSALVSGVFYAVGLTLSLVLPDAAFRDPASPWLWVFVVVLMIGVIAGNLRTIALPTLVTLLITPAHRDRANGLVGTTTGVAFLLTSVISGVLVARNGMLGVLLLALGLILLALIHLAPVRVPETRVVPAAGSEEAATTGRVDLRGTLRLIRGVPGLGALIVFSCLNNFLGGAFMALMDAYGLSLVPVQTWGLLWGVLSTGVIIGGLAVARTGLGTNPVRLLLVINLVLWTVTMAFPLRSSVVLLAAGMYVYMLLIPYAEAAEQTILQKVVPYQRQGRVFGFAQSVEQAASPITAFLIGPLTQFAFIPFMTDGWGARTFGGWFGTGADRGIALVFVLTGVVGAVLTLAALGSRYYRQLAHRYREPAGATG